MNTGMASTQQATITTTGPLPTTRARPSGWLWNKTAHPQRIKVKIADARPTGRQIRGEYGLHDEWTQPVFQVYEWAPGTGLEVPADVADSAHFVTCSDPECRRHPSRRCWNEQHPGRHVASGSAPLLQRGDADGPRQQYGLHPSLLPVADRNPHQPVRPEDLTDRIAAAQADAADPLLARARARKVKP
jgi:hypothetical protein